MDNTFAFDKEPASFNLNGDLRVLINGTHAKSGGGITYLRNILPLLASAPNMELHLFIHKDQLELFYPISDRVNVILLSFKQTFLSALLWEQFVIPATAWAMRCNVIFSPANYGPLFGKNHVILLRNAVSVIKLTQKFRPILYWLSVTGATVLSLLMAKKAIAVSSYAREQLTFKLPKNIKDKVTVVHHGVRQIEPDELKGSRLGVGLLAVSDIYIQKNYHTLLRAFSILCKKDPKLELIIIGQEIDHNYAKSLFLLVEKLGLEKNVIFKGYVDPEKLLDYYKNCRVFVFPSFVETFGNPLLEAMAVGVPIACSENAAMPEVLGNTGLFFDPSDEQDIADTIEKLLLDDALSKKLGKMASQRANTFLWCDAAQKTHGVLLEAADQRLNGHLRPL